MTQVKCAQDERQQLALRKRADRRSLAQRRADFAAQMREMTISDLAGVANRLEALHKELERKTSRTWTSKTSQTAQGLRTGPTSLGSAARTKTATARDTPSWRRSTPASSGGRFRETGLSSASGHQTRRRLSHQRHLAMVRYRRFGTTFSSCGKSLLRRLAVCARNYTERWLGHSKLQKLSSRLQSSASLGGKETGD